MIIESIFIIIFYISFFMNIGIKYKTVHFISLLGAVLVHGGIVAASLMPSKPIVLNNQAIHVSFVAPSALSKENKDISKEEKIAFNVEKKNATAKKAKSQEIKNKSKLKEVAVKETSGRVHKDSKALVAAESEPVFDVDYLNNPAPFYPGYAKRKGIQGKVLLNVVVKVDGSPLEVKVSHSSGSKMLDNAALSAVKNWRFIPAKKGGKIVQASVIVPIEFKII